MRVRHLTFVFVIATLMPLPTWAASILGQWQNSQGRLEFLSDNTCLEQHRDSYYGPSCTTAGCGATWGMIPTWTRSSMCSWSQLSDGRVHLFVNGKSYLVSVRNSELSIDDGGRTILLQRAR
jgi:hypothetical protein